MSNIERRAIAEIRASAEEDRAISGTAIVFNRESLLLDGMFTEIIRPEAVSQELLDSSDILMLLNHEDDQMPLARRKMGAGTLSAAITESGVDFSFMAKKTPLGEEALQGVRAGDVDSCSFAFRVAEGGDEWVSRPDGTWLRIITKFESLHDFSIVTSPAYIETSVRSLDKVKAIEAERRSEPPAPPADPPAPTPDPVPEPEPTPDPDEEINAYYATFEESVSKFSEL